jgi:hypothetical protein
MVANAEALMLSGDYHADQITTDLENHDDSLLGVAVLVVAALAGTAGVTVGAALAAFGRNLFEIRLGQSLS